jgi:hypothetical protein
MEIRKLSEVRNEQFIGIRKLSEQIRKLREVRDEQFIEVRKLSEAISGATTLMKISRECSAMR